jgi:hypothetical protein
MRQRVVKYGLSLLLLSGLLISWFPAAAQDGCDAAAINAQVDALIADYLGARNEQALQAAQDLQTDIAAVIAGCENESSEDGATITLIQDSPTPVPTAAPQPTPTPNAAAPTENSGAVPVGEFGDTGQGFSLRVTTFVRPANDVIEAQSNFNPEPEPGEEYVVVVVECEGICEADYFDFQLVGDAGLVYSSALVYYEGRLDMDGGTGGSGALPFLIRSDDTKLRLLYMADRLQDIPVAYDVGVPVTNLPVTPDTETAAGEEIPEGAVEVTTATNLNIREGPGTEFRVAGSVPMLTALVAIGRNEDGTWLRVRQGWVFAELVEGDFESLPVVEGE